MTGKLGLVVFVIVTASVALGKELVVESCGSTAVNPKFECESGCEGDILQLKKNSKEKFTLSFEAGEDAKSLTNNLVGILGGNMEIPYNSIVPTDFCSGLISGNCPVKKGDKVQFQSVAEILPAFPSIPVTIKWEVKSETGSLVSCIKIKSKII
uniref:Ecdysteroid-regulated protein n=1 Tax=Tortanus dextrilobatus TaxID=207953 RepID=A0A0U2VAF8_9MAXI|nr:ecdysteroid-regulated protein [Tortanus dextrilobatus]